ncbi:hypothetical protein Pst134EA_007758 [Puccinia striiformis f. sp. tritici]|nr:hypothetical protein Pst134EA_007758 [Puccinia striiformis f. sp. tritici]KAH9460661.1 hypothetical protein Pst134EB_008825 [Puccinia striiformis f. sp. tritici]KAH9470506.1 hypothetical protein Pst134EA_007758 [Puccinia striiformis f. sp. tritici]POW12303.1 hypothetical protein PSTT_04575 [Puccinia striiformis]
MQLQSLSMGWLASYKPLGINPDDVSSNEKQLHLPPSITNLQLAMFLYQEVHAKGASQLHAKEASQHEALSTFKIFRSDINTQIFTSIREKDFQLEWLHQQINKMHN